MSQGALPCQDIAASVTASCLRGWYGKSPRETCTSSCTCCFLPFFAVFSAERIELILFQVKAVTLASEIPWICKLCFSRVPVFWYLSLTPCELGGSYLLYETAEDQFCIKRDNGHSIFLKCSPVFASSCQVLSWRPTEERWSSRPRFTLLPCQVTECLATTAVGHSFAMETTYNKPAI